MVPEYSILIARQTSDNSSNCILTCDPHPPCSCPSNQCVLINRSVIIQSALINLTDNPRGSIFTETATPARTTNVLIALALALAHMALAQAPSQVQSSVSFSSLSPPSLAFSGIVVAPTGNWQTQSLQLSLTSPLVPKMSSIVQIQTKNA